MGQQGRYDTAQRCTLTKRDGSWYDARLFLNCNVAIEQNRNQRQNALTAFWKSLTADSLS